MVELILLPDTFVEMDYNDYIQGIEKRGHNSKISRNLFRANDLFDDKVERIGLYNEGTTCYINSLLQALYSIGSFRDIIYRVDTSGVSDSQNETMIILCLQRIFHDLQTGYEDRIESVRTFELLNQGFRWPSHMLNV